MSMFAFSNAILLGRVRARSLMNNLILRTKKRYHFHIFQDIINTKHTNRSRKLSFYSIKESSITPDTSDLSFNK